ncbi:MAG: DNA methyltransferase, partial [Elusimicrobia bacterium]|nr:DNA methyltransferase [Elusimicrobiota bacterium]
EETGRVASTGGRHPEATKPTATKPKRKRKPNTDMLAREAQVAGVSRSTMAQAAALMDKAPELAAKVKSGETTLKAATAKIKRAKRNQKVAEQARADPNRAEIRDQDALFFLKSFPAKSADLILTDPPYMTDVEDIAAFAAKWVPVALSRLKPNGRAYICTGAYPEELHAYLSVLLKAKNFVTSNVLVWTYRNTLGPTPKADYKNNWQAVFHVRGEKAEPLDCPTMLEQFSVQDINAPDGRQGDRFHAWQKPDELGRRLVCHSTKAGDLVLDPFAGTGTFILAAAALGRRAIGCDSNLGMVKIAEERGALRAT